jgi:hypothetical protein
MLKVPVSLVSWAVTSTPAFVGTISPGYANTHPYPSSSRVSDGIVLSDHGGRNLDTSPPSILVLLELRRRCPEIFSKVKIFIDGGIRRGTDVLEALCLGATAVGLGRPFLYALTYGQEGVEALVDCELSPQLHIKKPLD